jgi:hypothetical protein
MENIQIPLLASSLPPFLKGGKLGDLFTFQYKINNKLLQLQQGNYIIPLFIKLTNFIKYVNLFFLIIIYFCIFFLIKLRAEPALNHSI